MNALKRGGSFALWSGVFVFLVVALYGHDHIWGEWVYPVRYKTLIVRYATQYDIDPYIVAAIIRVESNFQAKKTSSKGAMGLMQLMPPTAQWMRSQQRIQESEPKNWYDEATNIQYGTWYIRLLTDQFVPLEVSVLDRLAILAVAYNAGPGKTAQWLQQGLWNGTMADIRRIPYGETRHYVERVRYYYQKFREYAPHLRTP
jgi:soluble lytic murein transglycosylase